MKESIHEDGINEEWSTAYDAQDPESPTFRETTRVSTQQNIEVIEAYLLQHPDLDSKEKAFLEASIALKRQNQENKARDTVAAEGIREDIANENTVEKEVLEVPSNPEKLRRDIAGLQEGMKLFDIDPETRVRIDHANSDMWKTKYATTDKRTAKVTMLGMFGLGKNIPRIEFYQTLGSIASENKIDLGEGKSVAEVISLLEQKAA